MAGQRVCPKELVSKYEANPLTNKKVMAKVVNFTTFDHQGQGHPEVKVTQKYNMSEVLPKGTLCPSMKEIRSLIRKLWPRLK